MTVITDHLLAFIWDMGAHGGEPFQGVKYLLLLPILGFIDNFGLTRQVSQPLL